MTTSGHARIRRAGAGLAFVTLFVGAAGAWAFDRQTPPPMPYDTYCQQEPAEKRRLFKEATPEHRAMLMRTHLQRWRDANMSRLTAAQAALLEEMIAAMTPAAFGGGTAAEQGGAAKLIESFEARGKALFSNEDRRSLRRDAPCVPKGKT